MDDIATHAGTSKSIMYRYFTDKTGLQQAVSEEVMQQIREALETAAHTATSPRDALRNAGVRVPRNDRTLTQRLLLRHP